MRAGPCRTSRHNHGPKPFAAFVLTGSRFVRNFLCPCCRTSPTCSACFWPKLIWRQGEGVFDFGFLISELAAPPLPQGSALWLSNYYGILATSTPHTYPPPHTHARWGVIREPPKSGIESRIGSLVLQWIGSSSDCVTGLIPKYKHLNTHYYPATRNSKPVTVFVAC